MSTRRTLARSAAVLGSAAALTVAGAGAAMATTHTSEVDGNDVSVTFELGDDLLDIGDSCGAVLAPTAAAAGIAANLADGNVTDVLEALADDESVTVLYRDGIILDTPIVVIDPVISPTATVLAEDVPSNVYALVSVCLSDASNPEINPFVLVGDPVEAITGSLEMGSSGGLDSASALLGDGGLDSASALLGDGEDDDSGSLNGDMLGLLSGSGEGDTED